MTSRKDESRSARGGTAALHPDTVRPPVRQRSSRGRLVFTELLDIDLSGTCLFYPCSGGDWQVPIQLFSSYLSSFWFVDITYGEQTGTTRLRFGGATPVSGESRIEIFEDESADRREGGTRSERTPFARIVEFPGTAAGERVAVRWSRHDGRSVLQMIGEPIGIFFYRGDGNGEGGSAIPWLSEQRGGLNGNAGQIDAVLSRMVDGGLLVTDGGNTFNERGRGSYEHLGRFFLDYDKDPAAAHREVETFEDRHGRTFRCIGYLERDGRGKGPTLVWQVKSMWQRDSAGPPTSAG